MLDCNNIVEIWVEFIRDINIFFKVIKHTYFFYIVIFFLELCAKNLKLGWEASQIVTNFLLKLFLAKCSNLKIFQLQINLVVPKY